MTLDALAPVRAWYLASALAAAAIIGGAIGLSAHHASPPPHRDMASASEWAPAEETAVFTVTAAAVTTVTAPWQTGVQCTVETGGVDVYRVTGSTGLVATGYGPYSNTAALGATLTTPVQTLYLRAAAGSATVRCARLGGGASFSALAGGGGTSGPVTLAGDVTGLESATVVERATGVASGGERQLEIGEVGAGTSVVLPADPAGVMEMRGPAVARLRAGAQTAELDGTRLAITRPIHADTPTGSVPQFAFSAAPTTGVARASTTGFLDLVVGGTVRMNIGTTSNTTTQSLFAPLTNPLGAPSFRFTNGGSVGFGAQDTGGQRLLYVWNPEAAGSVLVSGAGIRFGRHNTVTDDILQLGDSGGGARAISARTYNLASAAAFTTAFFRPTGYQQAAGVSPTLSDCTTSDHVGKMLYLNNTSATASKHCTCVRDAVAGIGWVQHEYSSGALTASSGCTW